MKEQFLPHNLHWQSISQFVNYDPQLYNLKKLVLVNEPSLLKQLPTKISGIYTLGGGRQIGKTTLIKQWIKLLLESGTNPQNIFFLTGEIINDHLMLIQTIQQFLETNDDKNLTFIIIDEVTYIKNWDQGIKYLADLGLFENVIVILTGSDLTLIKEARMRFPGRRGISELVDFHLYPLSFFEFIRLKHKTSEPLETDLLLKEFDNYLIHGGFLTAINSLINYDEIKTAIYRTYSDWIRGDVIKRGKSENYLKEFLVAIIKTYGSQITWNSISHHTSINHPQTIQDYANLLEAMDVLFIQSALIEDKLLGAPKKAKKIVFKDPFILHAINRWIFPLKTFDVSVPSLVESCVVSHYQRFYDCFYIKAEGEVDLAYLDQNKFYPVEIKWTQQLRPKDLKQISKYNNGLILTKNNNSSSIGGTATQLLPFNLFNLGKKFYDEHNIAKLY
jgi:predicted AAA+ superfamily ATPase